MTTGNSITLLQNGDEIFPAMLEAIEGASWKINFCTYVYWKSDIASQFAGVLAQKARSGVAVKLIVDAIGGATMDTRTLRKLEQAGVQLAWFRPLTFKHVWHVNHRTHRKILVVDDAIGFTGGVGIAEEWTGRAHSPHHWRETHCRLTGPVCADLTSAFLENWQTATGQKPKPQQPEVHLPSPQPGHFTDVSISAIASRGGQRPAVLENEFIRLFESAHQSINLTTAYFVPNERVAQALVAAANRKVVVRVVTNGSRTNHRVTRWCSRALYEPLLAAGIKIYEYHPTVLHSKVLTIDGQQAHIGSANVDDRSLLLNDEFDITIPHQRLSKVLDEAFEADVAQSLLIRANDWSRRPWRDKALEKTAWLLRTQV